MHYIFFISNNKRVHIVEFFCFFFSRIFLGCDSWKQLVMLWLRDEMTFKKLGFPAGSKVFF